MEVRYMVCMIGRAVIHNDGMAGASNSAVHKVKQASDGCSQVRACSDVGAAGC